VTCFVLQREVGAVYSAAPTVNYGDFVNFLVCGLVFSTMLANFVREGVS
jgi:hypothetical protein